MCKGLILAAGYASRVGSNKMALTIENIPIIKRCVNTLLQVCDEVVVVTGPYHDEIVSILRDFPKVRIVKNENYDLGMFSSVKKGVQYMDGDFLLTPGDYPLFSVDTCSKLIKSQGGFVVPSFNRRRGHPVFISKGLIEELKEEPLESNLKVFRDRHEMTTIEVDDEGILLDVDTIDDYKQLVELVERRKVSEN